MNKKTRTRVSGERKRRAASCSLTKAEARAFRKRWQLVNAREEEELRSTPLEVKWRQFITMLGWARQFGWQHDLEEGVAEVRERWARLRKALRG